MPNSRLQDWISIDTFSADGSAVTKQVFEQNIFCGNFSVISFPAASADQDRCADFSGGNLVVTGSRSKIARLWDPKTGNLKRSMPGHAGSTLDLGFFGTVFSRISQISWRDVASPTSSS